jgi:DNA-binding MarR family transcriptional regulator
VTHPVNGLDEIVHQRVRLGILAIAQEAKTVDFGFLQTTLELTAGNLSHNLTVLEGAGLIRIQKGYEGKRPRTRVQITPTGRQALQTEIAQLKQLIAKIDTQRPGANP